jgi:hypothetical protein
MFREELRMTFGQAIWRGGLSWVLNHDEKDKFGRQRRPELKIPSHPGMCKIFSDERDLFDVSI